MIACVCVCVCVCCFMHREAAMVDWSMIALSSDAVLTRGRSIDSFDSVQFSVCFSLWFGLACILLPTLI